MDEKYSTKDYDYPLPDERIAKYPLEKRDDSKLLVYHKGKVLDKMFKEIPDLIPSGCLLFFNDTKVIEARLHFFKDTGAKIEVFLLSPVLPSSEVAIAMKAKRCCTWKCTIGNKKKWKPQNRLVSAIETSDGVIKLSAELVDPSNDQVAFTWDSEYSFAEIIHFAGKIPIPPYLHREKEDIDNERYQTVYSHHKGAVAAPTAGLHFTDHLIDQLKDKGVCIDFATLHVGAGTFKPVQESDYRDHEMHTEQIVITKKTLENLLNHNEVFCVGTTSLRILESLFWVGVKLLSGEEDPFFISKDYPYKTDHATEFDPSVSLAAILDYLERRGDEHLGAETQIFIYPGYSFRLCKGLITNFHLPKSTLLLLISAFVGENWKEIYDQAIKKNYRFLSYGDSSLLIP